LFSLQIFILINPIQFNFTGVVDMVNCVPVVLKSVQTVCHEPKLLKSLLQWPPNYTVSILEATASHDNLNHGCCNWTGGTWRGTLPIVVLLLEHSLYFIFSFLVTLMNLPLIIVGNRYKCGPLLTCYICYGIFSCVHGINHSAPRKVYQTSIPTTTIS
jgi:hypothetical protein